MPDEPKPEQLIDITGPKGETLFFKPMSWIVADKQKDLQAHIDEMWQHYGEANDDQLVAVIGALCVENSIDLLLIAFAPGFPIFCKGKAFTFSVKINMAKSLRLLPTRILTACDLIRQIRNQFAHELDKKRFEDLDEKLCKKLEPYVRDFNDAPRNPNEPQRLFKELVSFVLMALKVYAEQVLMLRSHIEDEEGMRDFKEWCKKNGKLHDSGNSD